jgi:hypothetical protein
VSLIETIEKDFLEAQKARNESVVSTLRLLKSEIQKKAKDPSMVGKEMNDEVALQILKIQVKQRNESIAEYRKANREDLASKEEQELKIIEKYLPEQMSEEQIREIVKKVVANSSANNFGAVMKEVMAQTSGAADGKVVSSIVKEEMGA